MTQSSKIAARLLESGASAYAAYATNQLLDRHPELKDSFGPDAFGHWKNYFTQRVRELAAAVDESHGELFVSQFRWDRAAFQTRNVGEEILLAALESLRVTLNEELPANCRSVVDGYVEQGLAVFGETPDPSSSLDQNDPTAGISARYLLTILEGKSHQAIEMILDEHRKGLSLPKTFEVLMKAQAEIGSMWHRAEISVGEEHLVSNTTQRAMSILTYFAERKPANGLSVVSAAVAGNTHDLGLRAISAFFELDGWQAIHTGIDNPSEEIANSVASFGASLVLISAALPTHLKATRESVQAVRSLQPDCKIILGGRIFLDSPALWQQFNADGFATAPVEAVALGNQLCADRIQQ